RAAAALVVSGPEDGDGGWLHGMVRRQVDRQATAVGPKRDRGARPGRTEERRVRQLTAEVVRNFARCCVPHTQDASSAQCGPDEASVQQAVDKSQNASPSTGWPSAFVPSRAKILESM